MRIKLLMACDLLGPNPPCVVDAQVGTVIWGPFHSGKLLKGHVRPHWTYQGPGCRPELRPSPAGGSTTRIAGSHVGAESTGRASVTVHRKAEGRAV